MNNIREEIDAAIAHVGEIRPVHSDFFKFIGDSPVEDVQAVFGYGHGSCLHGLCSIINLSHPDLGDVFSLRFMDMVKQALEVAAFVRKKGFNLDLSKILKSEIKDVEYKLNSLKVRARLLQRGEREAARCVKKIQSIDLSNAYKKCGWGENVPVNFDLYVRNSTAYKTEMEKYEKQAEHFKRLGCESMCKEIQKSLDSFQESFDDTHYGFRRITMTLAALIIAKTHNYLSSTGYIPAACPSQEIDLPERIRHIIETVDNFPEARGNPIFDYYIVLVPNINSPENLSEAIANKTIFPVLLGERDGKCYFVSIF